LCLTQAVDFRRPPAGFAIERHSSFDPRRYDVPAVNPAVKPISLQKRRSQNVFCRASPCQDDSTARLAGWRSYYNRGGTRKGLFDACVFEVHDKLNQAGSERQAAAIDVSRDFWPGDPANAFHFGNTILGKAIFGQGASRRFSGKAIFGQRVFARPTLARRIQRRRGSRQCIQARSTACSSAASVSLATQAHARQALRLRQASGISRSASMQRPVESAAPRRFAPICDVTKLCSNETYLARRTSMDFLPERGVYENTSTSVGRLGSTEDTLWLVQKK
jgi:hypothetical protein